MGIIKKKYYIINYFLKLDRLSNYSNNEEYIYIYVYVYAYVSVYVNEQIYLNFENAVQ